LTSDYQSSDRRYQRTTSGVILFENNAGKCHAAEQ
jgi:hypothetical protein